jgi:CPA1 family monovalent cation:H+ antiporter
MDIYRQRIENSTRTGEDGAKAKKNDQIERKLRLAALKAERDEIFRIARQRQINDETMRKLVREIDLLDARYGLG